MISMKKIAEICGVSEATVSKALGGKGGVGVKNCERIKSVARKYNYTPNGLVRGIQNGFTKTIGIISGNEYEDAFAGQIMRGIDKVIDAENFSAMIVHLGANSIIERDIKLLHTFAERRVDGLLIVGKLLDNPIFLQELRTFSRPIVLVDQADPGNEFDFVGIDDTAGIETVAEHLLELGHRDIAYCGILATVTDKNRLEGLKRVMAKHNIVLNYDWIYDTKGVEAYDFLQNILSRQKRPSAIVCFNDYYALEALAVAYDLGIKVPEQLSVTGFADLPISHKVRPALTTVAQDAVGMGETATNLLLSRIKASRSGSDNNEQSITVPKKILIPTSLVIRTSTSRPYVMEKGIN